MLAFDWQRAEETRAEGSEGPPTVAASENSGEGGKHEAAEQEVARVLEGGLGQNAGSALVWDYGPRAFAGRDLFGSTFQAACCFFPRGKSSCPEKCESFDLAACS